MLAVCRTSCVMRWPKKREKHDEQLKGVPRLRQHVSGARRDGRREWRYVKHEGRDGVGRRVGAQGHDRPLRARWFG